MIRSGSFILAKGMRFTVVTTATLAWALAYRCFNLDEPFPNVALVWAAGCGILTYMLLVSTEYFAGLNPVPNRSRFLNILLVAPFPALLADYIVVAATNVEVLRYREVFLASPFVALGVFVIHRVSALVVRSYGRKRRLRTALLPDEDARLRRELAESGLDRSIEISSELPDRTDGIVISRGAVRELSAHKEILDLHLQGVPVIDFRLLMNDLTHRIVSSSADAWSFLVTAEPQGFLRQAYFQLKLIVEPLLAAILLVALLPLMLFLALLIRFSGPGPIIYSQTRAGHRGRAFRLHKFRTMRPEAEAAGPQWASQQDDRITPLGRFLRRSRLDELPQVWNIVRGELSFVGPRPERPEFYDKLREQIPLFGLRTLARPGLTGWAQVNAGYAASVEESRLKLEYDLYYMQRMSPRLDALILIKTVGLIFRGGGGR